MAMGSTQNAAATRRSASDRYSPGGCSGAPRLLGRPGAVLRSGLLWALCVAVTADVGWASRLVVLKSSDLTPYNVAAAGIDKRGPRDVKIVTLAADKRAMDLAVHATWAAKPDVIVALGARAADVAAGQFATVPVVVGMVADTYRYADGSEMVAGIELIPSEAQVLRAVRAVLADVHDVAVVYDPERSSGGAEKFKRAGKQIGITVRTVEFSRDAGVESELRSIANSCDCLIVYPDAILLSDKVFGDVAFRAFALGIPTVAYSSAFARKGALMSVEADYASVGKSLSDMADQIIQGASPGALGIHPPSRVKIAVNRAVAGELGVTVRTAPDGLPADIVPSVEVIADDPRLN